MHSKFRLQKSAILCGFYSRVGTDRERRLLNSVLTVKPFVNVRVLKKVFKKYDGKLLMLTKKVLSCCTDTVATEIIGRWSKQQDLQ